MIPIARPSICKEEIESVIRVLESGIIAQGPKVSEFEGLFSKYVGSEHGIATNSGTAALHIALLAHGLGLGDEIITTPFSFIATANCIKYVGATPVFSDIGEDFNLDVEKIEDRITERTKAIIAVHLFGLPCDMGGLTDLCEDNDLILIEDCAQAHGAEFKGKKVGSFGTGCFSFYPTKNMTTSEGGIITTSDEGVMERSKMIRNHGMKRRYYHEMLGYNLRMTDIEAAIGIEQLKKLDSFNDKRISNARIMDKGLMGIKEVEIPTSYQDRRHVYHQYTIKTDDRDELARYLTDSGIGTGIYYPLLINEQYGLIDGKSYPRSSHTKNRVLSLPIHPNVSKSETEYIAEKMREYYA